jgi:hypothetical protein
MTYEVIDPEVARRNRKAAAKDPDPRTVFNKAEIEAGGNRLQMVFLILNELLGSLPPGGDTTVGPEVELPGRRTPQGVARALLCTNAHPDQAQHGLFLQVDHGEADLIREVAQAYGPHYPVLERSLTDTHVVFVVEAPVGR